MKSSNEWPKNLTAPQKVLNLKINASENMIVSFTFRNWIIGVTVFTQAAMLSCLWGFMSSKDCLWDSDAL